jgi:hypothetical protein
VPGDIRGARLAGQRAVMPAASSGAKYLKTPCFHGGMATQNQTQAQNQTQVDRREIVAIVKALARTRMFVVRYRDVYEELASMIDSDEEFYEIENRLYEDISEGRIRYAYKIYADTEDSDNDVIVVTPDGLSEQQLAVIREIARLYAFAKYDGSDGRAELDVVIHNLVKMWFSSCTRATSPAESIIQLAKNYGLRVEEEDRVDNRTYTGSVYYSVEGLGVRIVRDVGYCNYCMDFPNMAWSFVEKCTEWRFESE